MKQFLLSFLLLVIATPVFAQADPNQTPTISNIKTTSPLPGVVEITWKTSFDTSGCVKYGKATTNEDRVCNQSNFTQGNHLIRLEDLDPGAKYKYQIVAVNSFGTEFETITLSFTVRDERIIIDSVLILKDTNRAEFSFLTDYPCIARIEYREQAMPGYESNIGAILQDEHDFVLRDLIPNTTYQYRIRCIDDEDIEGSYPEDPELWNTFTTLVDPTYIPPIIEPTPEQIQQEQQKTIHQIRIDTIKRERIWTINPEPAFTQSLAGRLLLQVEEKGEVWYVSPRLQKRIFLADGEDAYNLLRDEGEGITNADLLKIPVDLSTHIPDEDRDQDGLSDRLEEALGTNPALPDTDGDGYSDKTELEFGYSPNGSGKLPIDETFAQSKAGMIFLQVQENGEAWYVNPQTNRRSYLGTQRDAYEVMRLLSLGISNTDIRKIDVLQ